MRTSLSGSDRTDQGATDPNTDPDLLPSASRFNNSLRLHGITTDMMARAQAKVTMGANSRKPVQRMSNAKGVDKVIVIQAEEQYAIHAGFSEAEDVLR